MIVLNNGDKIQGICDADAVIDFVISGVVGETVSQMANGQLASALGDLYTASDSVVVSSIILVNTDTVDRTINLYVLPSGGTARRFIPKDLVLKAGFSLHFNGTRIVVIDTEGKEYATAGTGGTTDHSQLSNLDYVNSGHTGFEASGNKDTANGYAGLNADSRVIEIPQIANQVTVKSGAATLTLAEAGLILVSATADYTLTLPTAVGHAGLTYHFVKTDANYNLITLDGDGTETFNYPNDDGVPKETYPRLNTYGAEVTVVSDGSNWQVINEKLGQVPECRVYLSANQENLTHNTWTLVLYDTKSYNIGNNFDTTNHKFVAPIPGRYSIVVFLGWVSDSVEATKRYGILYQVNSTVKQAHWVHTSIASVVVNILSDVAKLSINDEITVYADSGSDNDTADIEGTENYPLVIKLISKD